MALGQLGVGSYEGGPEVGLDSPTDSRQRCLSENMERHGHRSSSVLLGVVYLSARARGSWRVSAGGPGSGQSQVALWQALEGRTRKQGAHPLPWENLLAGALCLRCALLLSSSPFLASSSLPRSSEDPRQSRIS